jgi:hypothetical protein
VPALIDLAIGPVITILADLRGCGNNTYGKFLGIGVIGHDFTTAASFTAIASSSLNKHSSLSHSGSCWSGTRNRHWDHSDGLNIHNVLIFIT